MSGAYFQISIAAVPLGTSLAVSHSGRADPSAACPNQRQRLSAGNVFVIGNPIHGKKQIYAHLRTYQNRSRGSLLPLVLFFSTLDESIHKHLRCLPLVVFSLPSFRIPISEPLHKSTRTCIPVQILARLLSQSPSLGRQLYRFSARSTMSCQAMSETPTRLIPARILIHNMYPRQSWRADLRAALLTASMAALSSRNQ